MPPQRPDDGKLSKALNDHRMERCFRIKEAIMERRRTKSFIFVVRATERLSGLNGADLSKQYFSVGVGDNLTEVPFLDVLVIFSIVKQTVELMERHYTLGPFAPSG